MGRERSPISLSRAAQPSSQWQEELAEFLESRKSALVADTVHQNLLPRGLLDFGNVTVLESSDRTFTVTNSGGGTLTGTASTTTPFSIVSGGTINLGAGSNADGDG